MRIKDFQIVEEGQKASKCQLEVITHHSKVELSDNDSIPPLRILSFDIECISTKGFPKPDRVGDEIITIGIVVQNHNDSSKDLKIV